MIWLTNFYDFRFKWTATAGIGIHPTNAWLSQLVNFKNEIWTLEEWYAIKLCFKLGKNSMRWKLDIPENKRQGSQWEHAGSPRQKKARQSKSIHKLLRIPFFDCTGMIYMHWVSTGQTVNKEYYIEVLRDVRKRFRRKRPALKSGHWHFQSTTPSLSQTIWPRWASSPDLAPLIFNDMYVYIDFLWYLCIYWFFMYIFYVYIFLWYVCIYWFFICMYILIFPKNFLYKYWFLYGIWYSCNTSVALLGITSVATSFNYICNTYVAYQQHQLVTQVLQMYYRCDTDVYTDVDLFVYRDKYYVITNTDVIQSS